MSRAKLLEAVNLFETTLDQSARLGNERLDGHRREAIQLRRVLSTQTADIAQLGGEVFVDPACQASFRREFSKMRSAAAFHQASWPVVSIDFDNPDYLESLAAVRKANQSFISWIRAELRTL